MSPHSYVDADDNGTWEGCIGKMKRKIRIWSLEKSLAIADRMIVKLRILPFVVCISDYWFDLDISQPVYIVEMTEAK